MYRRLRLETFCIGLSLGMACAAHPLAASAADTVTIEIDSFTFVSAPYLKQGDKLTATMRGTPGGQARFYIPGATDEVKMSETSPGVYVGVYTVGRDVSVRNAAILGN